MTPAIERLQSWYLSNCDGDWEHEFGVEIETLDNPGWTVKIDLQNTGLEGRTFPGHSYGVGDAAQPKDNDNWIVCEVANGQFTGAGGPKKLDEILTVFLDWADT
jgi:hypothetical protein